MMASKKRAHLVIGFAGVAAFVVTGAVMHFRYGHLHGMPDGPRMVFRSAHI